MVPDHESGDIKLQKVTNAPIDFNPDPTSPVMSEEEGIKEKNKMNRVESENFLSSLVENSFR